MSNVRITGVYIERLLAQSEKKVTTVGDKTTIVHIVLPNGFVIVESNSCVYPDDYDLDVGREICEAKVMERLWELESYLLHQKAADGEISHGVVEDCPPEPEEGRPLDKVLIKRLLSEGEGSMIQRLIKLDKTEQGERCLTFLIGDLVEEEATEDHPPEPGEDSWCDKCPLIKGTLLCFGPFGCNGYAMSEPWSHADGLDESHEYGEEVKDEEDVTEDGCWNCHFFKFKETLMGGGVTVCSGQCRFGPPTEGGFPSIHPAGWCGEHKAMGDR